MTQVVRGLIFVAWSLAPAPLCAELSLAEVIENVRANEDLYRSIELVWTSDYQRLVPQELEFEPERVVTREIASHRVVFQRDLFYLKSSMDGETYTGVDASGTTTMGYDGVVTRLVGNVFANIIHGRQTEHPSALRPHIFVIGGWNLRATLSEFMSTTDAKDSAKRYRWSMAGLGEVDGIQCIRVRFQSHYPNVEAADFDTIFWLAPDRNYLPLKAVSHRPQFSPDLPVEVTVLRDLREISPGIWVPFFVDITTYDATRFADGIHAVDHIRRLRVQKAELDPEYHVSLFRDIEIPDGIPVYTVKDGEVIGTELGKSTVTSRADLGGGVRTWLLIAAAAGAGVLLISAALALRRGRASRT